MFPLYQANIIPVFISIYTSPFLHHCGWRFPMCIRHIAEVSDVYCGERTWRTVMKPDEAEGRSTALQNPAEQ